MSGTGAQRQSDGRRPTRPGPLPGEPSARKRLTRALRAGHAGEYGARRVLEGQLAVLGRGPDAPVIEERMERERARLAEIERLLLEHRVRPTLLHPLWHVAGFAAGAGSALLGRRMAIAVRAALEQAMETGYARAASHLEDEPELKDVLEGFRAGDREAPGNGPHHGSGWAPGSRALAAALGRGCRAALCVSKRI